jgi:hypothetical protein
MSGGLHEKHVVATSTKVKESVELYLYSLGIFFECSKVNLTCSVTNARTCTHTHTHAHTPKLVNTFLTNWSLSLHTVKLYILPYITIQM